MAAAVAAIVLADFMIALKMPAHDSGLVQ